MKRLHPKRAPAPTWPRLVYSCGRCTLDWAWPHPQCPGCGHTEISQEPNAPEREAG